MKNHKGKILTVAAIVAQGQSVQAQSTSPEPEVRLHYYFYQDQQGGGQERMRIQNPTALVHYPIDDTWIVQSTFTYDTLSGASPLYHDTLTGASGLGIGDERWSNSTSIVRKFERFDLVAGVNYSEEQDYTSVGSSLAANIASPDTNTTFSVGVSGVRNDITSTNNAELKEHSTSWGVLGGVTQVINQRSLLQANLSYITTDGFTSDQYKLADNRPASRDQWAFLARYRLYFPEQHGALHLDYRFFQDTWSISSHMLEAQWYQELNDWLMVRPHLRVYTQAPAFFYNPIFPPENEKFYSADQRVSGFGSVSSGLKLEILGSSTSSFHLLYEVILQKNSLRIGSKGSPALEPFYGHILGVGMTYRW